MLEELSVRNYALIDNLTLSFDGGLNILTGETGAGKSIIVGALSFLLGAKALPEVIRTGCDEAGVSAVISVDGSNEEFLAWLGEREIEAEEGRIIVRRTLKASGRSSMYIQNVPLNRTDLADAMAYLFDLHGQHAHESLLRKEAHRKYLDRFAGLEEDAGEFNRTFLELAEQKNALETSLHNERDRDARIEMLRYAVDEIAQAAPRIGEIRELEGEAARLGDFEKLAEAVNGTAAAFFDDTPSLLGLARRARAALETAAAIDGDLAPLYQRVEDLYYEAEDLAGELRSYRDGLSDDPERLEAVEERLALLYRLKKKYRAGSGAAGGGDAAGEEGLLRYRQEAEGELEALSRAGENREKLKERIGALEKEIARRAAALTGKRQAAARGLGEKITGILSSLGMPKAVFSAAVSPKGQGPGSLTCGPWGADDVEFLISANAGEPQKELSRIASGGELSRVMLAIKTVLADADTIETLVFDEIDTGIGGEVALAVGDYLVKVGKLKQIFCITHLASIAVRADNHWKVEKRDQGGRTVTTVRVLNSRERREEIARMLAGDAAGSAALAHADDLLAKYAAAKDAAISPGT